jgi:hypothetical protein
MINGKNPKFPATGCQDEEKSRSKSGLVDKICPDFKKRVHTMMTRRLAEKTVGIRRIPEMTRSFKYRFIQEHPGPYKNYAKN